VVPEMAQMATEVNRASRVETIIKLGRERISE